MSERAEALASQFEQANQEMIAEVERSTDAQWKATSANDERAVGVVANHVAGSYKSIGEWVRVVAEGGAAPPITMDMINEANARHAVAKANCTKEETLDSLRRNGAAAAALVRGFSDEQLDRGTNFNGRTMTAQQMIENILIAHIRNHLQSMRAATPTA